MQSYSEIRLNHARRISSHLVRIYGNVSIEEKDVVEYLLNGVNLKEILSSIKLEKYGSQVSCGRPPCVSATSISISVGDDPEVFFEKFSKALADTHEAAQLKYGTLSHE